MPRTLKKPQPAPAASPPCGDESLDGDAETITAALATAADELRALETAIHHLESQLHDLLRRATQLRDFITQGRILIGQAPSAPPRRASLEHRITAHRYALHVLQEVGRPMRAQEIADYLHARGLMRGRWTREALRTAMRTHPEFTCISQGLYALTAWLTATA